MSEFVPQEVVCPGCGMSFHQTTPQYTEEKPANGTMFELKPFYGERGENWSSFPNDEWIQGENLVCPGCGCPYTSGTRVRVRDMAEHPLKRKSDEKKQAEADPEVKEAQETTKEMVEAKEEVETKADKKKSVKIGGKK